MIDFRNIEHKNRFYEALYLYTRWLHKHVYYKHYDICGRENIPPAGVPYIAICNHQNGLNDALGMLFALDDPTRRPVFIARADIFQNDYLAKGLRLLRVLPAFRVRDTGKENLGENDAIFNRSAEILEGGGVVAMFPEGVAQKGHWLGMFKKGFSRIAFSAEEMSDFKLNLQILPMANHYSEYQHPQCDLTIQIGKPFGFSELFDIYKEQPQRAHVLLCEKAHNAVQSLMLDMPEADYAAYDTIRHLYAQTRHATCTQQTLAYEQQAVAEMDELRHNDSAKWTQITEAANQLQREAKVLHLHTDKPLVPQNCGHVIGQTALFALMVLPSTAGFLLNLLPYLLIEGIVRLIKNPILHATLRIALGILFIMPLFYMLQTIAVGLIFGWWTAPLMLIAQPVGIWLFLRAKDWSGRLHQQWRCLLLRNKKTYQHLLQLRQQILAGLSVG